MEEGSIINILREFDIERDYEAYSKLWCGDNEAPPPISSLPPLGLVINKNKFFGFLALTDCDFAIITFYREVEGLKPKEIREMYSLYFEWCKFAAKSVKKKYVFCFAVKNSIIKLLESHGFVNKENGHMIAEVF